MSSFVRGVLEKKNREQDLYCYLTLRLPEGERITLFDSKQRGGETKLLSDQLIPSAEYHLLLAARVHQAQYFPEMPAGTALHLVTRERVLPVVDDMSIIGQETIQQNEVTQGIVLDPLWSATSQQYQAITSARIYNQRYVLLQTCIGNMLANRRLIELDLGEQIEQMAHGGYIEWEPSRLDLLAVIDGQLKKD